MDNPFFVECMSKIQIMETHRIYCGHGFQHLIDVARIAYIIMLESGDIHRFAEENDLNLRMAKEIIYATALLHDIGRWKEYETGEDHALVSADLAFGLLEDEGFNEKEVSLITGAIREHRKTDEGSSLLGKVLYKADKLSRLCSQCEAGSECYKFNRMETGREGLIY